MRNRLTSETSNDSNQDGGSEENNQPASGRGSGKARGPYNTQRRRLANLQANSGIFHSENDQNSQTKTNSRAKSEEAKPKKPLKFNRLTENIVNSIDLYVANKYDGPEFITEKKELTEFADSVHEVVTDLLESMQINLSPVLFYTIYAVFLIASFCIKKYLQFVDIKNRFMKKKAAAAPAGQPASPTTLSAVKSGHATAET